MAGIQIGGIVSGMDTNALVDQITQQAQVPVDKLYGERSYKLLEEKVYEDFDDMLGNLTTDLLTLRLESTFKTKVTSSTNEGAATATATTDAAVGTHTVKVEQLANNAMANSAYTRFSLSSAGAGVVKATGLSGDYLQGVNTTTVAQSGADYVSTTELKVDGISKMQKTEGADIDAAYVDSYGELLQDITGDFTISYTDNDGNAQTMTLSGTWGTTGEDITDLAARMEFYLNENMNAALGTNAVQYMAMRAEYETDGSWNLALYETTVDNYNISVNGTDAGTLRDELGFAEAYTPTTSTTDTVTKYHVADSLANLTTKMFVSTDGFPTAGVVAGGTITLSSATVSEGTFSIAQDASLNVSSDTYSNYTSGVVTAGAGLDVTAVGLDSAGFSEVIDDSANGFFTINDVKIEIEDYTSISVTDLLGIINASGAGVTATYDDATDTFEIRSNKTGATSINLGNYGDTSDLLSMMKFNAGEMTYSAGTSSGSIDTTKDLQNSGMTVYPYSGTFTINGVSIYVDAGVDSLEDVIEKVNASGAGVTMGYDATSDKVTLRSDGIDAIKVGSAGDTSNLLEALNLTDNTTISKSIGSDGQNAVVVVDGTTYVRDSNEVSDILTGVTLTLNGESETATTINIQVDTDKAIDAFATFVSHYNEVMEALAIPDYDKDDKKYMTYLTDTKKESMSEEDIKEYQEKYDLYNRYDIIRRSTELKNMDNALRRAFFGERTAVSGSVNDMSDLFIEVAGAGDLDTEIFGYIVELTTDKDEIVDALKDNNDFIKKLSEDPDGVFDFFSKSTELDDEDEGYAEDLGWSRYMAYLIDERYTSSEGMIGGKLGSSGTLYSDISRLEDRIETQEERVETELERYWAKFTAMEQAIADAQASASGFNNAASG